MEKVIVKAPAKINLALDIKGMREDGFHEVAMIMQSISLADTVIVEKAKKGINVSCRAEDVPGGRDNLAHRAAEIIGTESDIPGIRIHIKKRIPVAAGLGGGSSDAAAVLKGINHLFSCGYTAENLMDMAARIGSDVPFFIGGGTALATGRGTRIKQLSPIKEQKILLIKPPVKVSTARIYNEYDNIDRKLIPEIPVGKLVKIIKEKDEIRWDEGWDNALEPVTISLYPEIKKIKEILATFPVKFSLMCGSGPTIFSIPEESGLLEQIIKDWPREDDLLIVTGICNFLSIMPQGNSM